MFGLPTRLRALVAVLCVVSALAAGVVAVDFVDNERDPSVGAAAADQADRPSAVPRTDRPHRWHDVDRVGPNRLAVADIGRDSVFVVDTRTGERTYEWSAQSAYDLDSGGPFPRDWTHLNDVEHLPDGR